MKSIALILLCSSVLLAKNITLGVVPQQSPLKLTKKWSKITNYLTHKTGVKVIFKTENSIPAFEKKLYAGEYDFAYSNPYHFVLANKSQQYEAKIRANKLIKGIMLSKEIKLDLNNLKNKTFLFPAPKAFAATLLLKHEFKEKFGFNIEKDAKFIYVNSHDSVYKGVSRDIGDFGGGITRTYKNFKNNSDKNKLNIVYTTKGYPSHPIAFHPRIDKKTQDKLVSAFLEMPLELKNLLSIKEFINTTTHEYDVIKKFD